jgi:hypothetical protein
MAVTTWLDVSTNPTLRWINCTVMLAKSQQVDASDVLDQFQQ